MITTLLSTYLQRTLRRSCITKKLFEQIEKQELQLSGDNKPFPSSRGPLYQNEVKFSAFDMEMIFQCHANKTHFHKKGCALDLILKLRVFGTRNWPTW